MRLQRRTKRILPAKLGRGKRNGILSTIAVAASVLLGCQSRTMAGEAADAKAAVAGTAALPGAVVKGGRALFLRNCAHCHGADGHGDDGPDLHDLDLSDEGIARRIRNGKKGQMTAFAGKLQPAEIEALAAYVRTLK